MKNRKTGRLGQQKSAVLYRIFMLMKVKAVSRLSDYRKLKGMTQEELAERSGITTRTIQRIESGQVVPQMYTLKVLANCLDTGPQDLIEDTDIQLLGIDDDQERKISPGTLAAMHVLPLIGIFMPLMNILIPLAFWLLKKDENPAYDGHGRRILNFQITITLVAAVAIITMFIFLPVGYPLLLLCYGYATLLACLNMARALKGKKVSYPLSIRFMKNIA